MNIKEMVNQLVEMGKIKENENVMVIQTEKGNQTILKTGLEPVAIFFNGADIISIFREDDVCDYLLRTLPNK